jgi:1-acyl-sn-glycerol-3-phosphate acyltransferase
LSEREGFIRLAASHGSSLVPVFCFNENESYDQFSNKHPAVRFIQQQFQSIFGVSLPLPKNIMPNRVKMTCVYGEPLQVLKNADPDPDYIKKYQKSYIESIEKLYATYGPKYNSVKKTLTIR